MKAFNEIDQDATETLTYKGVYVIIDYYKESETWQAIDGGFRWKVRAKTRKELQKEIENQINKQ